MAIVDILLYGVVFLVLLFALAAKIRKIHFRYDFFLYLIPAVCAVLHFAVCGLNEFLLPLLASSVFIFLLYPARKRWLAFVPVYLLALILVGTSIYLPLSYNMQNYASLSYTESLSRLNDYFAKTYPLASYKKIDFSRKYDEFYPIFAEAEKNNDRKAFFYALNAYLASFSDAHISALPADLFLGMSFGCQDIFKWRQDEYSGDLGFSAIRTDDCRALAANVTKSGSAYAQGLRDGDEIISFDAKTPEIYASDIPLFFAPQGAADESNRMFLRYLLLGRCPMGESHTVIYRSAQTGEELTVSLQAVGGDFQSLQDVFDKVLLGDAKTEEDLYCFRMINEKTGYMRIATMMYPDEDAISNVIANDLSTLTKNQAENLIIDLRCNGGGEDTFGAKLKGFFTDKEDFYLSETVLDGSTGELRKENTINVSPKGKLFSGNIIIMVNAGSASAAEGFAYNMAELDNVRIAGMNGSNGSFGTIDDGFVLMPENYLVLFPRIACVEEDGNVMIDTDSTGCGGVKPDIKIPINEDMVQSIFTDGKDYELDCVLAILADKNA